MDQSLLELQERERVWEGEETLKPSLFDDDSPFGPDRKRRKQALAPDPPCPPGMNPADHKLACARARADIPPPPPKPKRTAAAYTTDYLIDWGRSHAGWELVEREGWERHNIGGKWLARRRDIALGMDAYFATPDGPVYASGAGKGQRAAHYARFVDRGGPDLAAKLHVAAVWYVEFLKTGEVWKAERWV